MLDVHTNPKNPVIGDRALSEKAETVARIGAAMIRAFQGEGVAACGKHFPGHGDTQADSHLELPIVEHPLERLRQVEFLPFKAAIEAQVATIMTAHVLMPAIDEKRPATLSREVVTDLLRNELKFDGVILSDDLEMKAIAAHYPAPAAAALAIDAGCDGVLICSSDYHTQAATLEGLVHAVEGEHLALSRVEDAIKRHERAKQRFLAAALVDPPPQWPCAPSADWAGRASCHRRSDGAVSLMLKPRRLEPGSRLAVVAPASSFDRDEFDRGVAEIQRLGFEPVYDESVFARQGPYLAGSAELRASAFRKAWVDPSIAGLIAVRGGFGSAQVLPFLDRDELRASPKALIGYSDITSLFAYLTTGCEVVAFHGPMLEGRLAKAEDGYDRDSFLRVLGQSAAAGELISRGMEAVRSGDARARCLAAR